MSANLASISEQYLGIERSEIKVLLLDNLIWPILILALVLFSVLLPDVFSTARNLTFLLYSSAALGSIVLAESICLLSGNFDLSVGSIAGFSAMFTALFLTEWFPGTSGFVGVLVILCVGGFIGLLNGVSIAKIGVNPFLQTLSFFIIFRGAVILLSTYTITDLPDAYVFLGGASITELNGFPVAAVLILALFAATWVWLKYFRTGLSVYAVGGDEESASEAGINTDRVIIMVYILSGILAALGGLLYTGYLSSATPSIAQNNVFPAFAAAIVGGISLFGGRGNILGALGGVLLLGTIQTGLTMLGVSSEIVQVVNGVILLSAILLYTGAENYREQLLSV